MRKRHFDDALDLTDDETFDLLGSRLDRMLTSIKNENRMRHRRASNDTEYRSLQRKNSRTRQRTWMPVD